MESGEVRQFRMVLFMVVLEWNAMMMLYSAWMVEGEASSLGKEMVDLSREVIMRC